MLWNIRAYNSLSTLLGNLSLFIFTLDSIPYTKAWLQYPSDGIATMTHYTLPENYIASCGCTAASTHFPTAALSQQAYGSSTAYGPGCGRCFKLTLLNTFLSDPPFFPDVAKSIVVKITDLCPAPGGTWCSATASQPNEGGSFLNFDLAWPSPAIPDDFFPSNASFYGYTDFGVWNISYESVSCLQDWAGSKQRAALGSVDDGSSACCPADPTGNPNNTCPSFSDNAGVVPPNTTNPSATSPASTTFAIPSLTCVLLIPFILYHLLL